jgi:hypothetical protein
MRALAGEVRFRELLRAHPVVADLLPPNAWEALFDPKPYFTHVDTIFRRIGLGETTGDGSRAPEPTHEGRQS